MDQPDLYIGMNVYTAYEEHFHCMNSRHKDDGTVETLKKYNYGIFVNVEGENKITHLNLKKTPNIQDTSLTKETHQEDNTSYCILCNRK